MSDEINDDLERLVDLGIDLARKSLLENQDKQLAPVYYLIGESEADIIVCQWTNDFEKRLLMGSVKVRAREIRCRAFAFVSEAWMVGRSLPKTPDTSWHRDRERIQDEVSKGPPPSQDPKRIEIVQIVTQNRARSLMVALQIIRDKPGGQIVSLVELHRLQTGGGRAIDGIIQPL